MKWFTKVRIKNFLTHKDTELPLHPGINVIVGGSDAGKSAFIKALRWLCYNEPRGDGFVRMDNERLSQESKKGKKENEFRCSVEVELSDGVIVERSVGLSSGSGRYTVTYPGQDPLVLTAFGRNVPIEVSEALGFAAIDLGSKGKFEVNYMPQLGEPMALAFQGEELSRMLNLSNSLDDFEEVQSRISTKLHPSSGIASNIRLFEKRISEKQETLENMPDVSGNIEHLDSILSKISQLVEAQQQLDFLSDVITEIDAIDKQCSDCDGEISHLDVILASSENIKEASQNAELCSSAIIVGNSVQECDKSLLSIQNDIDKVLGLCEIEIEDLIVSDILSMLEVIEANALHEDQGAKISEQISKYGRLLEATSIVDVLSSEADYCKYAFQTACDTMSIDAEEKKILEQYETFQQEVDVTLSKISELVQELAAVLQETAICPMCFSEVNEESVQRIVQKYEG